MPIENRELTSLVKEATGVRGTKVLFDIFLFRDVFSVLE